MSLNTFLTLFWYFIHFFAPKSHSEVMRSSKMTYFSPLGPYKGKWLKSVIFHDFFKLLLGGLIWCFRYHNNIYVFPRKFVESRNFWKLPHFQRFYILFIFSEMLHFVIIDTLKRCSLGKTHIWSFHNHLACSRIDIMCRLCFSKKKQHVDLRTLSTKWNWTS